MIPDFYVTTFIHLSLTKNNCVDTLFSAYPYASPVLAVGRNPCFGGEKIELNCSFSSNSRPDAYRTNIYYFWSISQYGSLRNISSGPAVLKYGDTVPGYSIKNDGKTLVIASAQYTGNNYNWLSCAVQEEGSPYKSSDSWLDLRVYSEYLCFTLDV